MTIDREKHFMFVIYFRPSDYPKHYVVRPYSVRSEPGPIVCLCDSLKEARQPFLAHGLFVFTPDVHDDPVIVETWL